MEAAVAWLEESRALGLVLPKSGTYVTVFAPSRNVEALLATSSHAVIFYEFVDGQRVSARLYEGRREVAHLERTFEGKETSRFDAGPWIKHGVLDRGRAKLLAKGLRSPWPDRHERHWVADTLGLHDVAWTSGDELITGRAELLKRYPGSILVEADPSIEPAPVRAARVTPTPTPIIARTTPPPTIVVAAAPPPPPSLFAPRPVVPPPPAPTPSLFAPRPAVEVPPPLPLTDEFAPPDRPSRAITAPAAKPPLVAGTTLVLCSLSKQRQELLKEDPSLADKLLDARHEETIPGLLDLGGRANELAAVLAIGGEDLLEALRATTSRAIRGTRARLLDKRAVVRIAALFRDVDLAALTLAAARTYRLSEDLRELIKLYTDAAQRSHAMLIAAE